MVVMMWLPMQGKITAQGKLLLQDTLLVVEQPAKAPPRVDKQTMKERRVFLFEQIVIFSEEIDKRRNNMSSPGYIYKNSIKVSSRTSHRHGRDFLGRPFIALCYRTAVLSCPVCL